MGRCPIGPISAGSTSRGLGHSFASLDTAILSQARPTKFLVGTMDICAEAGESAPIRVGSGPFFSRFTNKDFFIIVQY